MPSGHAACNITALCYHRADTTDSDVAFYSLEGLSGISIAKSRLGELICARRVQAIFGEKCSVSRLVSVESVRGSGSTGFILVEEQSIGLLAVLLASDLSTCYIFRDKGTWALSCSTALSSPALIEFPPASLQMLSQLNGLHSLIFSGALSTKYVVDKNKIQSDIAINAPLSFECKGQLLSNHYQDTFAMNFTPATCIFDNELMPVPEENPTRKRRDLDAPVSSRRNKKKRKRTNAAAGVGSGLLALIAALQEKVEACKLYETSLNLHLKDKLSSFQAFCASISALFRAPFGISPRFFCGPFHKLDVMYPNTELISTQRSPVLEVRYFYGDLKFGANVLTYLVRTRVKDVKVSCWRLFTAFLKN